MKKEELRYFDVLILLRIVQYTELWNNKIDWKDNDENCD